MCHFSDVKGHIGPKCFTMLNFLQNVYLKKSFIGAQPRKTPRPKIDLKRKIRKFWVKKFDLTCLASFTCLRACAANSQYLDSGRSRYMIGDKSILVNYKSVFDGLVTFRDGVQGKVLGKGTLSIDGFPKLKKVMHVEGLKANLINISQICDLDLNVHFNYEKYRVLDSSGNCVLKGSRSLDNCCTFTSMTHTCHNTITNETDLWHEKLGHLNFKNLKRITYIGAANGLPTLSKQSSKVCGPCQFGKQLKTTQKVVQQISTTKVLKLLHMDLRGPMQVESIASKQYICVCVDE